MNKKELVAHIAAEQDMTKEAVRTVINSMILTTTEVLKDGGAVQLVGFGVFSVKQHTERKGRNPRTGQEIVIKARRLAKFTQGKTLAKAIL